MQHSDKTLILKRTVKIAAFVIIFMIINYLFRMGLEHPETASEEMIAGYTHTENLDTIVAGSSVAEMINSEKLDEILGSHSYNMCTPSQSYGITTDVITLAASQNDIKRVYYFASLDATERRYDNIPERTFKKVVNASHPVPKRITNTVSDRIEASLAADTVKTEDSVNTWFPWIDNSVDGIDSIKSNFSRRFDAIFTGRGLGYNYGFDLDKKIKDINHSLVTEEDMAHLEADLETARALDFPDGMVEEVALRDLDSLCRLCRDNNIELYMFISPHRSDYKDRYEGNYEPLSNYMKDFVENRGAFYYNFESDPDIHTKLPDSDFYDWEHVNAEWVDDATTVIAERIQEMQSE